MGYSKKERLEIGRQIYEDEINKHQAATRYGVCEDSARKYMREYRDANNLPPKEPATANLPLVKLDKLEPALEGCENMTKAELIDMRVAARIDISRLPYKCRTLIILYGVRLFAIKTGKTVDKNRKNCIMRVCKRGGAGK